MIKVLILGAEGMLGSACLKVFQQNPQISLLGTSRNERKEFLNFNALLDDDLHSLPIKSSDYVVNCIGMIN
jgi:dTDP-4-dehydrorhamnose reductase